jgi:xylulokinase
VDKVKEGQKIRRSEESGVEWRIGAIETRASRITPLPHRGLRPPLLPDLFELLIFFDNPLDDVTAPLPLFPRRPPRMPLFVGHDVGTSGTKSVLLDEAGRVRATAMATHRLLLPAPGLAEQEPEDWLRAVGTTTRALLREAGARPEQVVGVAFAGQMLTLVPLDAQGRATRRAIAWMDDRAEAEAKALIRRLGGATVLRWLAGAVPTGKDLVAKVAWLRAHEPETFARTARLGDATSWLVARTTGEVGLDPTAAAATGLLDLGTRAVARRLAKLAGFPVEWMPTITESARVAGRLHADGAEALGLPIGTEVAAGLADIPAMALGTGATRPGDTHLYLGTSSWAARTTEKPAPIARAGIAAIPSGDAQGCLSVGESEAAGACRAWALRMLGLAAGHGPHGAADADGARAEVAFDALAEASPPGARGLLFAPWLYGERAPFPDAMLRGGFANLSLEHERSDLARAVLEGVALNLRIILEKLDGLGGGNVGAPASMPVSGGGAQSDLWLQILADVTGRPLRRVARPRFAGARGAALIAAVATGAVGSVSALSGLVEVDREFVPHPERAAIYDGAVNALRSLVPPYARAGALLRGHA